MQGMEEETQRAGFVFPDSGTWAEIETPREERLRGGHRISARDRSSKDDVWLDRHST